jgi:hypothetical protein
VRLNEGEGIQDPGVPCSNEEYITLAISICPFRGTSREHLVAPRMSLQEHKEGERLVLEGMNPSRCPSHYDFQLTIMIESGFGLNNKKKHGFNSFMIMPFLPLLRPASHPSIHQTIHLHRTAHSAFRISPLSHSCPFHALHFAVRS